MNPSSLEDLFTHPGFLLIFLAILITIGNIMVGVSILSKDKRKHRYRIHRYVYLLVVAVYGAFLWVAQSESNNALLNYGVLGYLLFAVPVTRRINETLHAVIASIGLVLLVLVATFNLF